MDRETIEHVARLARLRLRDGDAERYATQLDAILAHFRALQALDTEDVEPAAHAVDLTGRVREDEPRPGPGPAALFANAPAHEEGFILVPRVIE